MCHHFCSLILNCYKGSITFKEVKIDHKISLLHLARKYKPWNFCYINWIEVNKYQTLYVNLFKFDINLINPTLRVNPNKLFRTLAVKLERLSYMKKSCMFYEMTKFNSKKWEKVWLDWLLLVIACLLVCQTFFYIFFVAFYKIIQKREVEENKKENNGETKLNMTQIFTPVQFFLYPILSS